MIEEVWFRGKKIGEKEMRQISMCFGEKIEDIDLMRAILTAAMMPGRELERGAFTRALKFGHCSYTDGGRAAKKLIRLMRSRLGYRGVTIREITRAQEVLAMLLARRKKTPPTRRR